MAGAEAGARSIASTPSPAAISARTRSAALRALRAELRVRARERRHRAATTRCTAPTSSGSRWSRSTARSCPSYVVDERLLRERLESRRYEPSQSPTMPSTRARAPSATAPVAGERLSLGVAARLSRYLQVLTQAKKMGKETISSQELSDYTHVNSTQIRRDLSGFGKFGKRGVGYNVESLVSQIRKILRTAGQHNIALFGAGHLGQAIASSDIFADHGFRVVAIFDVDPAKVGNEVGSQAVRHIGELRQVVEEEDIVVGVLAVPTPPPRGSPTSSSRPA